MKKILYIFIFLLSVFLIGNHEVYAKEMFMQSKVFEIQRTDPFEDEGIFDLNDDENTTEEEEFNCKTIFVERETSSGEIVYTELGQAVDDLFTLIKVITPIIVIALSTMDYIKAIASSNADDMKKANQRTIKRLIVGLIVFFLPFLLEILFELFGLYDLSTCGVGT